MNELNEPGDASYLDCATMRQKFFWSTIACEAAAPLIQQARQAIDTGASTPGLIRVIFGSPETEEDRGIIKAAVQCAAQRETASRPQPVCPEP